MNNRWNNVRMDKAETKIRDGEDQNEEFSQKEVGKDNIKEKLKNMEDRSRNSRKTEREEKRKIKKNRRKYWKK